MKQHSNTYQAGTTTTKQTSHFWMHLLQWLRLLVLSLSRIKKATPDFYKSPNSLSMNNEKANFSYQIKTFFKTTIMKLHNGLLKMTIMLLLFVTATKAFAQPYPNTGNQSVCINSTQPYGVPLTVGSSYIWSVTPLAGGNGTITPGVTSNLISVNWTSLGTATLQVTETNSFGCVGDPVTIVVTINPLPTVTVNSPAVCAGTAASITATPGSAGTYNYVWTVPGGATNPGNVATFTSTVAGVYSVVITNTATTCSSASASGTVTVNVAPTVLITNPPPTCSTVDLTAASVTAGSTAGLAYTYWTDLAATIAYATPAAATAGTYYIKGTAGTGCFAVKQVVVTANPAPTVSITNPAPTCTTADLTAAGVTAGSTAGLTYTYWTDIAATIAYATPTAATAGTYYIKGTTAAGCFAIKPVVVTVNPAPTPVITGPSPVCQSVNASTSPYNTPSVAGHAYTWTATGGTIATGQGTNAITVTWSTPGAGSVSVTETITASTCAATVNKPVTVNPKPVTTPITHN